MPIVLIAPASPKRRPIFNLPHTSSSIACSCPPKPTPSRPDRVCIRPNTSTISFMTLASTLDPYKPKSGSTPPTAAGVSTLRKLLL
jgi:hypothetical protein